MEKASHYLDIRIAIDFHKTLKPDVVEGFKMALGLSSEEAIFGAYSKMIVNEIESDIVRKRYDHVTLVDAELKAIDWEVDKEVEEVEEVVSEDELVNSYEKFINEFEEDVPLIQMVGNSPVENQDFIHGVDVEHPAEKESFWEILDSLNEDLFTIKAYNGKEIEIHLIHDICTKYGDEVARELNLPVYPYYPSYTNNDGDIEYKIEYKVNGVEKRIVKKLNESKGE